MITKKDILEQVCTTHIVRRIPVGTYEMAFVFQTLLQTTRLLQVHETSFAVLDGSTVPCLNLCGECLDSSRKRDRLDPEMDAIQTNLSGNESRLGKEENGKFMPIPNANAFVMSNSLVHVDVDETIPIDAQDPSLAVGEDGRWCACFFCSLCEY